MPLTTVCGRTWIPATQMAASHYLHHRLNQVFTPSELRSSEVAHDCVLPVVQYIEVISALDHIDGPVFTDVADLGDIVEYLGDVCWNAVITSVTDDGCVLDLYRRTGGLMARLTLTFNEVDRADGLSLVRWIIQP